MKLNILLEIDRSPFDEEHVDFKLDASVYEHAGLTRVLELVLTLRASLPSLSIIAEYLTKYVGMTARGRHAIDRYHDRRRDRLRAAQNALFTRLHGDALTKACNQLNADIIKLVNAYQRTACRDINSAVINILMQSDGFNVINVSPTEVYHSSALPDPILKDVVKLFNELPLTIQYFNALAEPLLSALSDGRSIIINERSHHKARMRQAATSHANSIPKVAVSVPSVDPVSLTTGIGQKSSNIFNPYVKLNPLFKGSVSDFSFSSVMLRNYAILTAILQDYNKSPLGLMYAGKYKDGTLAFVVKNATGDVVWVKTGEGAGGQNYLYVNGTKHKTSSVVDATPGQLDRIFK